MRDVVVVCGGAPIPRAGSKEPPIVLNVGLRQGRAHQVTLSLAQITRQMVANVPDRLADLLEIACYVHAADQLSPRDGPTMPRLGEDWYRSFAFRIAVRDPDFWNGQDVREQLAETLSFLSGDGFRFEFTPAIRTAGEQPFLNLAGEGPQSGFKPAAVILFSGGLDSFAGAVETILDHELPAVLVSHHASHLVHKVQVALAEALRGRTRSDRLLHVSVNPRRSGGEAVEFTQRTRSFLFATMGLFVARLFGLQEISFYENGVVSLNLPLAGHVLATRATRTTHPRTLHDVGALFSRVLRADVRLVNPFFWNTKADIVRKIAAAGCAELIPQTFSCAAVRAASFLGGQHCGVCSQCLDRRFGILAAGCGRYEPPENYAVDLLHGERKQGAETTMAESYVLAAQRHARSSQTVFLGAYGEVFRALPYLDMTQGEAAARLHRLHVRHGQAVSDVIRISTANLDPLGDGLDLPDNSLLSMILAPKAQDIDVTDPVEGELPAEIQATARDVAVLPRPITFSVNEGDRSVEFGGLGVVKGVQADVIIALLPMFHDGLRAQRGDAGHVFTKADKLADILDIEGTALRKNLSRLRRALGKAVEEQFGVALADDDVVQNNSWNGYRLNPYLSLTSVLSARSGAAVGSHVTTFEATSHLSTAAE